MSVATNNTDESNLRSGEILLQVLGGLLVAGLVSARYDFVEFLRRGCNLTTGSDWATIAYFAFALNVFRQIHGLAIVTTSKQNRPRKMIGDQVTYFLEIVALVAVVMFPSFFLVEVAQMKGRHFAEANGVMVLNLYLSVALAYVFWDFVEFFRDMGWNEAAAFTKKEWIKFTIGLVAVSGIGILIGLFFQRRIGGYCSFLLGITISLLCGFVFGRMLMEFSRGEIVEQSSAGGKVSLWVGLFHVGKSIWNWIRPALNSLWGIIIADRFRAYEPKSFAKNWQAILLVTLAVGACFLDGVESIPRVLTVMCIGYTLLDYALNWHFYFSSPSDKPSDEKEKSAHMKKTIILFVLAVVAIVAVVILTPNNTASSSSSKAKVVLQLKWIYNSGFVGDLVAKEKGFWKEQNLDVEVRAGGVGIAPIKVVASGDAQFGIATGDQLLLAAEENA